MAQWVESLLSMHEALASAPSAIRTGHRGFQHMGNEATKIILFQTGLRSYVRAHLNQNGRNLKADFDLHGPLLKSQRIREQVPEQPGLQHRETLSRKVGMCVSVCGGAIKGGRETAPN